MSSLERRKELKRRRHRRKKMAQLKRRVEKAKPSEMPELVEKIRRLSPGGEVVLNAWGIDHR